ncbi:hypothetical protein BVG19_g4118 [[Candida] boidinii]|nr:hypothetical protein BVG19_g4118 [[Candida] boidinii]OWB52975.1 hypothetical protein B5S27_g4560 [[Candida] boidinii]OWB86485.1 hypothetical protein B5S33_g5183 [[Candida] boidinii]
MSEISIETNTQENDVIQTKNQIHILDEKTSFALNLHSLKDIASNENLKKVYTFLSLSDELLEIAHSKGKSSLKSEKNLLDYYTLIKSSLNCLFKILTNCNSHLNSELEILIYYKISKLLFDETESLDLASEYVNKALSICSRKNLSLMMFQLELLNFQIQYKTDKKDRKPALNYLNRIIIKYKDLNLKNFELLLIFFKFQYFGMNFNPIQCIDTLRQISNEILQLGLNQYNIEFYQLCLIYEISQHLLRGSIVEAKSIIKILKNCQDKFSPNSSSPSSIPIQFITICELLEFAINIQENDLLSSKAKISKIDSIVKILKSKNYTDWYSTTNGKRENGKIIINLMINDPSFNNNNNINKNFEQLLSFPIEIKWLTPSEFRLTAFLYCGVCYISKSWDGKDRTEKLFDYCRNYIDDELKTENHQLSNIEAETKVLRLNYISTLLDYYECLANFQKDKWNLNLIKESINVNKDEDEDIIRVNKSKRIKVSNNNDNSLKEKILRLEKFVKNYDSGGFSSQELVIYHNLIIKIYYLLGMNSQHLNKLSEAKYYYMKTRKLCSSSPNELNGDEFFSDEMYVTFKQSTSGISGSLFDAKDLYNQIYCLSTLNLIIIISYEAQTMKNRLSFFKNTSQSSSSPPPHDLISNYEKILSLKNILTREVIKMIQPEIKAKSFVDSDFMFEITIEFIIKYIIKEDNNNLNNEIKLIDNLSESQLKKIKNISPFLLGLINYHNALSSKGDNEDNLRARNKVKLFKESIENFSKYQNLNNSNTINSLQFLIFYINTKILETIKFYETDFTKDELENQELLLNDLKLKLGKLYDNTGDSSTNSSLLNGVPPKLLATSFNDKENDEDMMKGSSSPSNGNFQENSSPYRSTDEKRGNEKTKDETEGEGEAGEDREVVILSSKDFRNKSSSPIFRTPTKVKHSERKRKYSFGSSPLKRTDKPNLKYHNDNDGRQDKHGLIINRSSSPAIENVIEISSDYMNNGNSNDPYSSIQ